MVLFLTGHGYNDVLQSSVLGPLLFLLYVNDISASVICKIKLFTDDTKIWNTNIEEDDLNLGFTVDY